MALATLPLVLTGCVRVVPLPHDAGPPPSSDGGGVQLDFPLTGDIVPDDEQLARIDPSTLPAGATPCMAPALVEVYRIVDGDTFHIRSNDPVLDTKIRFIGVNSPEIAHPPATTTSDCYGDEATTFTAQLLNHKVWLTFDNTCHDPYGRLLAYVHIGNGEGGFWQRQMLRRGFAKVLTIGNNRSFEPVFQSDENDGNMSGAGLWTACF